MLTITIPDMEFYDEKNNRFVIKKSRKIVLEHSLVSVSKWEAKWKKPYISKEPKSREEIIDYIRCMTITQNVDNDTYYYLNNNIISEIVDYIDAPMTATWFNESKNTPQANSKQITSELIYYWMISFNIPVEFQKWHLNRLITLIKVCNAESKPQKKRSSRSLMSRNAALNAARRKQLNSKG